MPRARRSLLVACVVGAWAIGGPAPVVGGPTAEVRHPLPAARRAEGRVPGETAGGSTGWWLGAGGLALVVALGGGISRVARRLPSRAEASPLQVVGRVSLSPRHSVVLLRVGGRVLIVGAGAQGPPALLGELTEPDLLSRFVPRPDDSNPDGRSGDAG